MKSIIFYQTEDRYILDVRWWSFTLWKKRKYWSLWDTMGPGHLQVGPCEVFIHDFRLEN